MLNIDISSHQNNFFITPLTLDGEYFIFKFNYNAGFNFWSLAIYNSDNTLLVSTKIICLFNFLSYCSYLNVPKGMLIFDTPYPTTVQYATENDFINKIVTVKYIPLAEVENLKTQL